MFTERRSSLFLAFGALLVAAGLLLWWQVACDRALHHLLRVSAGFGAERLATWLSAIGGLAALGPVTGLVAVALVLRRRGRDAVWLVVTITLGRLLVEGLKEIVQRPRPPLAERLADVTSWSFPSSHSAGSMMTCLAFACLVSGRRPALAAALTATAAIGWSRVALAVHWPSDVLTGWGMGMMWIGLAAIWRPNPSPLAGED